MAAQVSEITRTYTSFSGADITATFNGVVVGELQAITYSISREKAPIYTMGSAEPRSFSRGKRGIAGTLVFTVFNRDALIEELKDKLGTTVTQIQKYQANATQDNSNYLSIEDWDSQMSDFASNGSSNSTTGTTGNVSDLSTNVQPKYADEILPFDITISFANEYGKKASMTIYGVELLNEGAGFSIDNITSERAYTFVARSIEHMKPVEESDSSSGQISSTF